MNYRLGAKCRLRARSSARTHRIVQGEVPSAKESHTDGRHHGQPCLVALPQDWGHDDASQTVR